MRIQHNIAALNSYRNLTNNNSAVSKNLEKLSSGYKINRAGDDAAGLAISEKMRAQITGLETAQKNANDGISLVQTAEGALTEVHSMLNRMVELADQSANGTYQDEVDRENLQKEMQSLKDEINRISESTNFNGINLLDGSLAAKDGAATVNTTFGGTAATVAASGGATFSQEITIQKANADGDEQTLNFKYLDKDGNVQSATITFSGSTTAADNAAAAATELQKVFGDGYNVKADSSSGKITITAKDKGADQTQIISIEHLNNGTAITAPTMGTLTAGKADTFEIDFSKIDITATDGNYLENTIEIDGQKFQIVARGSNPKLETGVKAIWVDKSSGKFDADSVKNIADQLKEYGIDASAEGAKLKISKSTDGSAKGGLTLQIGDTSDDFNQLTVSVGSMDTNSLGIANLDISTQAGAKAAVDVIKNAINMVSSTRGDLGAIQNRLEHTINNLSVTTENMTAAESRIRDVDMAEEMMAYTKNNILVQSSQAMLAQANQIPQGVLQLLQ
ncbi:flagellin [Mediterraneibacter sp. NSJ-55]|uniref:Flagellin n=1 Tax=Mediterraneibacter hominis TaxID=2763054 RepID=A0A923LIH3_9FIRM|nr:flagellin [Mediterraneibacter hominis]MBC5689380.1 flagellin [Mediterraneibacter hominis]